MNNNGFKTSVVEHESQAVSAPAGTEENLAAQALEDMRDAERLSGFGRFATKVQGAFQASKINSSRQSTHLKAAPIMMSAGLLMLLATALLFLLSKPESTVHSHFRQPTGLNGTDSHNSASAEDPGSAVTENQLAGSDKTIDSQPTARTKAATVRQDSAARQFSFADDGTPNGNPSVPPNSQITSELQTPATVFVGPSVTASSPAVLSGGSHQPQLQLPSGTEIVAHTTNAINSGLESPVIAIVDRDIKFGDKVVIPQGSRVIGYTAGAIKNRINVRFTSLTLPNSGREISISGLALMRDGSAGLVGKLRGSGHPILAGVGRVATGASALAIQFTGQGNLGQPFSQADYLRNQLASEVASEGSRYSNRLQQSMNVPIVTVNTNESIRIFLLKALSVSGGQVNPTPTQQTDSTLVTAGQNQPPDQSLAATQTAYIQALEAQLADMRAELNARNSNGRH